MNHKLKCRTLAAAAAVTFALMAHPASADDNVKLQASGTFRGRYEVLTDGGESRFEVRNARLRLGATLYDRVYCFAQADLCDRGSMKILDAYARLTLSKSWDVQAGQFLPPFGTEPFRNPSTYLFGNRSFNGKTMTYGRAVGIKAMWHRGIWRVEAGAFNPVAASAQTQWHRSLGYAAKGTAKLHNVTVAGSVQTVRPEQTHMTIASGALAWQCGEWLFEGEGMTKGYGHGAHRRAWSWALVGNWCHKVDWDMINAVSVQGRFDGITAHSSGRGLAGGKLPTDAPGCNRYTGGVTLSRVVGPTHVDLRVNYERAFYRAEPAPGDYGSRLLAELVVNF